LLPVYYCTTSLKVFSTLRAAAVSKGINLSKNIAIDVPPKIVGDRYRVEHVISNLLSNAIKFSREGKTVSVEVSVDSISFIGNGDSSALITVKVTDEGRYLIE